MKYCTRCLYPANHPLHLTFDEEGVCSGCRVHEEKDRLDWRERAEKLRCLFDAYRSRSRHIHDCIIPVTGARDSHFIVHVVKNVFGMHPLLVHYNKHYNTRMGIRNLAYLRTLFGCDIISHTTNPETVKKITRETLRLKASMYWHCLAGHTAFPVQTAVRFKIPLIVWGAHQGCDQVGMFSHLDEVEMTRKYRKEHDLMGLEAEDLSRLSQGRLSPGDLEPYLYPHDGELAAIGVRGIYLGNYIRWDSKAQHEEMIRLHGYETMMQQRTFDTYNDVDCFHYSGLHDAIRFLKYGYGKVTDHATREIRLKRLTREEGIARVRQYQDVRPKDTGLFLDWLGMDERALWECIDPHRDSKIWEKQEGKWTLKDSILNHEKDSGVEKVRLTKTEDCHFHLPPPRDKAEETGYVLLGRGWVDNT
ncbi:N-acetyl sugar amidotransferase [Desulfobotulus mexicanus]|uniref:N-acetyl sugar amidotransferase n=1 Tax=Desulfobotulus mexicanus TaxID=2586642 RepID=A0A5Q4VHA6_9BACT|nr:N-acetyl sugar amidotransferase [Desulfobotulus mexicanus]TYT76298.1 N-acetyl sugar amidotransferase [Desulfobotulus mexicanus]